MYDQSRISKAASDADRAVELTSLPEWCAEQDIELLGIMHVASQRALRAAMIVDGLDPTNRMTRSVNLSATAERMMTPLSGAWMDGFACAWTLLEAERRRGERSDRKAEEASEHDGN